VQNSPIRLGSIDLHDFEIPQSLRFGGRHRLAVHALAGGKRIIERLGPDDGEILFRGTFSGPTAESRARAFDNLRLSGEIVWLTWQTFRRQVIVRTFTADYHSSWWITYQIGCIVADQTGADSSEGPSAAAVISADLTAALSGSIGSGISLSFLQAALSNTNSLIAGTAAQALAAAQVSSAMQGVNSQMNRLSAAMIDPLPPGAGTVDMSQSYLSKVNCAGALAAVANIRGYVGRIGTGISGSDE
jgi:hypothetical protein